jgi:hypothetical protein
MMINIVLDFAIGLVPFLGDVADDPGDNLLKGRGPS